MKAERWRHLEQLYDAALERSGAQRDQFVLEACAGDEELRRELLGLLEAEQRVGDFLELPALDVAAQAVANEQTSLPNSSLIGRELGPYRIERLLGAGGMGQVYLALDAKLGRRVALKILPRQSVYDPAQIKRFGREAQAISALNHPNLVTIFDIGIADEVHFIATEYVEGSTLRDLIKGGMNFSEALAIITQIAHGLAAAHQAGVLHRDIKPENIMVRPDGYVKVLDFGLAKLSETDTADPANLSSGTEPGLLMGTLAYMSPEQAAGEAVDQRTDIWSLGIMSFEMVTGHLPARGATRMEILSAILSKDPVPVADSDPPLPVEFEHIIGKALEKDRELRYQTASDLRADLKRLQRDLDSSPSVSRTTSGFRALPEAARAAIGRPSSWRRTVVLVSAIVVGVLLLGWVLIANLISKKASAGPDWAAATNQQLTIEQGPELFCSLAPDGNSFVYVSSAAGNNDIYVQRVGGKNPTNLTKDSTRNETTPAYSRDGKLIAFHSAREPAGLYVMEATGENPRRVSDLGFHPSWSPDGKEIVVGAEWVGVHANKSVRPSALWIVNLAKGEKRLLTAGDGAQPSWSPGGGRIAYWSWSQHGRGDIETVPASGGPAVKITSDDAVDWNPVWSPDGKFIYFSSDRGGSMNFWRIAVDETTGQALAAPEAVPSSSKYAFNISFSHDGRTMIYVRYESIANLQSLSFDPASGKVKGDPVWVTRGFSGISNPELSPNGERYVFRWPRWTQDDIAVINKDGTNWRTLTDDKFQDRRPRWFPDNQRIAFASDRSGSSQIWSINADGTGLTQLTFVDQSGAIAPVVSPDGKRLAFVHLRADGPVTLLIDLTRPWPDQTLELLPTTTESGGYLSPNHWSPNGDKLIGALVGTDGKMAGIGTYTFASKSYERVFTAGYYPTWLSDNHRYLFGRANAIYLGDTAGGEPQLVFKPPAYEIQDPTISADNGSIFYRYLQVEADVWSMNVK